MIVKERLKEKTWHYPARDHATFKIMCNSTMQFCRLPSKTFIRHLLSIKNKYFVREAPKFENLFFSLSLFSNLQISVI